MMIVRHYVATFLPMMLRCRSFCFVTS